MSRIRRNKRWRALFVLLLASAACVATLYGCAPEKPTVSEEVSTVTERTTFVEGTTIDGENISGKTVDEAISIVHNKLKKSMEALEISIRFEDDTVLLKGEDFSYKELFTLTLPKLLESGEPGSYDLSYVTDLSDIGKAKIMEAAELCFKAPVDAGVEAYDAESGAFTFKKETIGTRVDINKTIDSVRQLLAKKHGGALQAEFITVQPELLASDLEGKFVQLGSYYTDSTNTENGTHNMALAMKKMNGTVLKPGEEFSFNGVVGDSTTLESGFLPAGGLSGGVSVQMIGGGICQASTTLYGAVIRSGLEITKRECHSLPSTYCPIGLDATVDYGNLDFCFRNNMKTPVYLSTWMDGVRLHATVFGVLPDEWDKIEVYSNEAGSYGTLAEVRYVQDSSLAPGEYVLKTSGNYGYEAVAGRTFYKDGEVVKKEELPSSYYPPTGKVYAIGPNTDTSKIDAGKDSGSTVKANGNSAPTPKPPAATPKPNAATPKPPAATPKPPAATPKPPAATPKPPVATPAPTPAPTPPPVTPTEEPNVLVSEVEESGPTGELIG